MFMKKPPVVFIVKKEYYNIGIGYMAAVLRQEGFETEIIDSGTERTKILKQLRSLKPVIVGFSVIYQYHIDKFIKLIRFLRKGGITCHFTAGGHYASLKYEELLKLIPSLDSVVRFEGEYTMRDLVKKIYSGKEWNNIKSIAYMNGKNAIANPLRPLEKDLDMFPYPLRTELTDYAFGRKYATILAGRGCLYNCSFCNLKEFFLPFRGSVKRIRKPEMVVKEMDYLSREKDCSVFLFQDDDFPVKHKNGSAWIEKFCEELKSRGLSDKIMWKINCRPDEVNPELFAMMKKNGLFLVFIGIEDGTDSGLKKINKNMTVAKSLAGINTLKKLEIGFDFGFMLFQPYTTFTSLSDNLEFLRDICGDGYSAIPFLKLMPYYETDVERELLAKGRIKGKPGYRDYDFLDIQMNHYFEFLSDCFYDWTRRPDGVYNISKWARNYVSVCFRYFETLPLLSEISGELSKTLSDSNLFFLNIMKELAPIFNSGNYDRDNYKNLQCYRDEINLKHDLYKRQIKNTINNLSLFVELLQNTKPNFIDTDLIKTNN
jgi:anaerobic magnesium-protoporphyrin IX monomethyl ester cyclase